VSTIMEFSTRVEQAGKTATGLPIPDEVVVALAQGKRPPVVITVGGHSYRTTVASRGGRFMVPLSAVHREAAGLSAGDRVDVAIEVDAVPREVTVPSDLADALAGDAEARAAFDGLSYSHRKEWVRWVEEAKRAETRAARVANTVAGLRDGRTTH
jgi:Bacteriocin-protection, YdeI or OmpD-Associated/Domain of unknown function (DUF1905)